MLCIRRSFEAPPLGFRIASHLGLAEGHRVVATELGPRTVFDVRTLPVEPASRRAYVYAVLEGEVLFTTSRRVLSTGSVEIAEDRASFHHAGAHLRGPHRALALQLGPELLLHEGPPEQLQLDDPGRSAAGDLHRLLSTPSTFGDLERAHEAFFGALRRCGLTRLREPMLRLPSARHVQFAEALSRALCLRGQRPAQVDLEGPGAPSERTVRRLFGEVAAHYGWIYESWQPLRRQWSTILACLMLAVPESRPEEVARAVGLASVTSLHHALSRVGMPPPRELQARAATIAMEIEALFPSRNC